MKGPGANHVIFLPSGVIVFRFMDENDMNIDPFVRRVEQVRSSCCQGAAVVRDPRENAWCGYGIAGALWNAAIVVLTLPGTRRAPVTLLQTRRDEYSAHPDEA